MSFPLSHGIPLKKRYGQHFLRDHRLVQSIADTIDITHKSVFEIGCGDGFLTQAIIRKPVERLWVFEIDAEWAYHVQAAIPDPRLTMHLTNILDVDIHMFREHEPWILLANLPYAVTFPILHLLYRMRSMLQEGVIMIQEEVAEKIVKTSGKGYGYPSLFFQRYFTWKKLEKVPPGAFFPPPKVMSRLLHFKPRAHVEPIPFEDEFWRFIKVCFHQPRRTLRNNLSQSHFSVSHIPEELLALRAQQMQMTDLIMLWKKIIERG